MPLDPQAEFVLDRVPDIWTDVNVLTVEKVRDWAARTYPHSHDRPLSGIATDYIQVPGAEGPIGATVYRDTTRASQGAFIWFHGGGFIMESPESHALLNAITRASGYTVVSVEYRLAPENPFPAAPQDCYASIRWVGQHLPEICGKEGPLVIGGESAGGNLAAVAAQMVRDNGGPEIVLQILVYPMMAFRYDGPSRHDRSLGVLAPPEAIDWIWKLYLSSSDGAVPLASPLLADTLCGLPPAVIITAEYDLLRDEGEAYASRLERAGVPVALRRYDGMPHGFADWIYELDAARDCVKFIASCLARAAVSANPSYFS